MMHAETITGPYLLLFFIGVGLFSYSIYSGKRLLFDRNKTSGILYSIINYFLQLFQWSILGYGMTYSSGVALTVGVNGSTINFNFGATTTSFQITINSGTEFFLKINLIAILVIIVLFDILKERKTLEKLNEELLPELNEKDAYAANIGFAHSGIDE